MRLGDEEAIALNMRHEPVIAPRPNAARIRAVLLGLGSRLGIALVLLSLLSPSAAAQAVRTSPTDILANAARFDGQAVTSVGGKVKDAYLVLGKYDLVVVTEGPNDGTAAEMALGTPCRGTYRRTTMRALNREKMDKMVGSLP